MEHSSSAEPSASLVRFRRASQSIQATHVLDEVLMRVIAELHSALDAEAASVALLDETNNQIVLNAAGPVAERVSGLQLPAGYGILGWVIANRQPLIVNDVSKDSRFWPEVDGYSGFKTRSVLCAPLFFGPRVIGAVEVLNKRQGDFTPDDLQYLEAFGAVAASAIENARNFRQEQRRRRESDALRHIWETLTTSRDLDTLLHAILDQLATLIEYRSASVLLVQEQGGFELCASQGIEDVERARRAIQDQGLNAQIQAALESHQVVLIPDTRTDPRWTPWPGFEYVRSWIAAPLIIKGQLAGTLNVDHDRPDFYTAEHAHTLSGFAHQAAIAIENSRLYAVTHRASAQLAEQARRLVTLYETARSLLRGLELDQQALQQLLERLVEMTHARFGLLKVDKNNNHPPVRLVAGQAQPPPLLDANVVRERLLAALRQGREIIRGAELEGGGTSPPASLPDDIAVVAIHARGRLLGYLMLGGDQDVPSFSDEDEALALALAAQLATAIENATLYYKTQQRMRELEALYQISRTLVQMRHPDDVYTYLTKQVAALLNARRCAFFLFQDGQLVCQSPAYGLSAETIAQLRFPLSPDSPLYPFIHTPDPLISNDILSEPALKAQRALLEQFQIRRLLSCRVEIGEQQFGVLVVADKRDDQEFTEQDRHLASIMIHQVNSVLQRALLQARQQQHLQIQSALLQVSQAISNLTDLDALLQTVARITHQLTGCHHCFIALWKEHHAAFIPRASSGLDARTDEHLAQYHFVPEEWPFVDRVTRTREPVVLSHQDLLAFRARQAHNLLGWESCLVVPLVTQDRAVGFIAVGYNNAASAPGQREISLVTGIARQAAIAVENANLYQDLHHHARQLERAYRELRALDIQKMQFVQNISHELRTPFTLIKGYLELLLDEEMGALNARQKEGLKVIADKTAQLGELIDDIISIQSIDASTLELYDFDLALLLQAIAERFREFVPDRRFRVIVPGSIPIRADAGLLERALKHLLDNAVKFSPPDSEITLRAEPRGQDQVYVEVHDEGIGIPPEALPYVFDRFYQVDGSTTRRYGGTGLGLAIVKQIIEAHGGEIGVASEPERGSTFYFTLPTAPTP